MPGRISRVSAPHAARTSKPSNPSSSSSYHKGNRKRKSRGLDALNIAEHTHAYRTKIRQYRLGEVEDEEPRSKKKRLHGDDEDADQPIGSTSRRLQQKTIHKGGLDSKGHADDEIGGSQGEESGSDSEGGRWRVGVDEEDDDSEVDSEEAFGSGDEERFEGFTFRGSGKTGISKKGSAKHQDANGLDLDEGAAADEEEDEGSDFGGEGVDLATMLDDEASEEEVEVQRPKDKPRPTWRSTTPDEDEDMFSDEDEAPSEYSDEDAEEKFEMSEDEASGGEDATRQQQLQDLVTSSGRQAEEHKESAPQDRNARLAQALAALNKSSGMDPAMTREAQKLRRSLQPHAKDSRKSNLVSVPLPKRQQDRIDRTAARQETNKTLDRWVDTVKHNRRAEHLTFPLPDPNAQDPQGQTQLTASSAEQPRNDLERTIAAIMKESGLGPSGGKAAEKQLEGFEELQANKMSLEEVQARRTELRKQRELLFREEIKAKRIKKIKSKAYRRVHRKDAQKQAQKEHDLLVAAGIESSEDEQEANDRRRAEERMGARHKSSRWAKSVKATGRAAWDDEARDGVTEMARRNEELRRRQEGKREEPDGFESDVESSSDDDDADQDEDESSRLQRQLQRIDGHEEDGESSKLGSLKFMQRADAARRKCNDQDAEQLRKDLAGEADLDDSDQSPASDFNVGRRVFGPSDTKAPATKPRPKRAEFEEGQSSESEAEEPVTPPDGADSSAKAQPDKSLQSQRSSKAGLAKPSVPAKAYASGKVAKSTVVNGHQDPLSASTAAESSSSSKAPNTNGWTQVSLPNGADRSDELRDEEAGSDAEPNTDAAEPSNWDLVQAAFGGDDVDKAFETEKASAASSEDEKFEDNTLPGWGSWTGTGISKKAIKRDQQRKKGRFITKTAEGIKPSDRKDAAMPRVIISEKRQKKNAKYLANQLPHPYESRTQYERGLRQPVGPEWTTKQTFQEATKPRIITKPGRAIEPMSAPML